MRPGGSHTGMECDLFPGTGRGQRRVCKVGRYLFVCENDSFHGYVWEGSAF